MTIEKLSRFLQDYKDKLISHQQLMAYIKTESDSASLLQELSQASQLDDLDSATYQWLLAALKNEADLEDDKTLIQTNVAGSLAEQSPASNTIKTQHDATDATVISTVKATAAVHKPLNDTKRADQKAKRDKPADDATLIKPSSIEPTVIKPTGKPAEPVTPKEVTKAVAARPNRKVVSAIADQISQSNNGHYKRADTTLAHSASVDKALAIDETLATDQTLADNDQTLFKNQALDDAALAVGASSPTENDLTADTLIKDRFVIEGKIGRGGMGTVYKARDLRKEEALDADPYIAIKFLNPELRSHPQALIALQREAKKAQTLAHPNIVTVFDFDKDGERAFLTMEYLEGQTLDQLISAHSYSGLATDKAIALIKSITRGLAYAHNRGYVHADLKPSNIFVSDNSQVKLLDFGIAQAVKHIGSEATVDDSGFDPYSLGAITPNFASPEMLKDQPPETRDDMYSLGCIAYALLTGEHPFLDAKGHKLTSVKAEAQGLRVKKIPGLAKRYQTAIEKCLAFEGADRYPQAVDFINAIDPRKKLRKGAIVSLVALSMIAGASWWFAVSQSEAAIGLNDLPSNMAELVSSIRAGDTTFEAGDIDQAHKLYAQAWEASFETVDIDPRDQYKLKVILDRRLDKIIERLIKDAEQPDLDEFRRLQLQVALEALKKGELGTLDKAITPAIKQLEQ